jgi:hypothetical protein
LHYKDGLNNLERYIHFFDRAILLTNTEGKKITSPRMVYGIEKGIVIERALPIPKWARHLPVDGPLPDKHQEQRQGKSRKR